MQIATNKAKLAYALAAATAASAWMLPSLKGQFRSALKQGPDQSAIAKTLPRVYFKAPLTDDALATWTKLNRKVPMIFKDTPFKEFLKKIKEATIEKDDRDGIMLYIVPLGLSEADPGPEMTVALDLANVKLGTGLRLALDQLDLQFVVSDEGIVMISSQDARDAETGDPNALILDRIDTLREEIQELRKMISK